jgi:glutamine amidotransferase
MKNKIHVIDYGVGNIGSLINIVKFLDLNVVVTNEAKELKKASRIILPGVGSFDAAINKINDLSGLKNLILEKALNEKIPFLGICLGMQLLVNSSEEGEKNGLGLIKGKVIKFKNDLRYKIPHMGWNETEILKENDLIDKKKFSKFYFVHSYYVKTENRENCIGETLYINKFDSIIQNENIFGVQFHPERSHKYGMELLKRFSSL